MIRRRIQTPAHVSVAQTDAFFYAHVDIDVPVEAGDSVLLHGDEIRCAFGESVDFDRIATVERASWIERAWTRFAGHFGLVHLYEVSFSGRRLP